MRASGDRGAGLVDLVIGLALTTLAAASVAALLASATRTASPDDAAGPELAVDQWSSDVRRSDRIEVVGRQGAGVAAVELTDTGGTVRWELDRAGDLVRQSATGGAPRVMLAGARPEAPFTLLTASGTAIDPADVDGVRRCTRLVRIGLVANEGRPGDDPAWRVDRTVALRGAAEVPSC